ncbi:MAG: hypothetical protein LBB75_06200 [Oscillospiraceae bacterium]|jgi:hypothetical protein|nr:hypothetical protein [Oscillospiraceae bacterium]
MPSAVHTVIYVLLIFFVLLGVVAGIYLLMMLLLRPRAQGRFVVVIPSRSSQADVAALLCAARLRVGLMGDLTRSEVIALDCGMPEKNREECECLCRELDHTALVRPEELAEKIVGW